MRPSILRRDDLPPFVHGMRLLFSCPSLQSRASCSFDADGLCCFRRRIHRLRKLLRERFGFEVPKGILIYCEAFVRGTMFDSCLVAGDAGVRELLDAASGVNLDEIFLPSPKLEGDISPNKLFISGDEDAPVVVMVDDDLPTSDDTTQLQQEQLVDRKVENTKPTVERMSWMVSHDPLPKDSAT